MKVVSVCLGNTCRSPMTEAMFKKMVTEAGLADQITVGSAGASDIAEGSPADSRTKAILDKYHIKNGGVVARQLQDRDYYDVDYIIAMDQVNIRDAKDMAPARLENKVRGIFKAIPGKENCYIVDPWTTHRFQDTHDSLSKVLSNWLAKPKKEIK